jgi:cytochrome c peroxidase
MRAGSICCLLALLLALGAAPASAALTPMEDLGKAIFFDKISSPDNQSCAACHAPEVGFTGPVPAINAHGSVYPGAVPQRFGNRKPPAAAYATTAPNFHYDAAEGLFVGGNFWDGRATGWNLGNPAADQALGPFLNPVEQNNPSKVAVLEQIATSQYAWMWQEAWGEPLLYGSDAQIAMNYDRVGLAIAAYEGSTEVNAFTSKWDYVMKGEAHFTPKERRGMEVFEGKGMCSACHPGPLFTDYTFDNLGTPRNEFNPFYQMDEVYLDNGMPINPEGAAWVDPGLGGFLASLPESYFTGLGLVKAQAVAENWGKHKVPTLRNVAKGASADFQKAYMHNGVFTSLRQVINFYNTRDVGKWAPPEVAENVNTDELGNLGLTRDEVTDLLAFLNTLSDGWVSDKKPKTDTPIAAGTFHLAVLGGNPIHNSGADAKFAVTLGGPGRVELSIVDIRGRLVRRVANETLNAGRHEFRWNGDTDAGRAAARGVYFAVVRNGDAQQVQRLVWLR